VHPCVLRRDASHTGIRPIERHRWHYTYWQDTRDRPQVWVVGVTPLLSVRPPSHDWYPRASPSAADDISAVLRRARAQRDEEKQQRTFCITIGAQSPGVYSRNSKDPTWSSSISWKNASLHGDVHFRTIVGLGLSRLGITGFWTLQNGKYWIKTEEVLIDQQAARKPWISWNQRYSRATLMTDRFTNLRELDFLFY